MKRTPLRRLTALKRYTRLRAMSPKRKRESIRYGILRLAFLLKHPRCQVPGCQNASCDVHHVYGRAGSRYLDTSTWVAACRGCHEAIHRHPLAARAKGLLA